MLAETIPPSFQASGVMLSHPAAFLLFMDFKDLLTSAMVIFPVRSTTPAFEPSDDTIEVSQLSTLLGSHLSAMKIDPDNLCPQTYESASDHCSRSTTQYLTLKSRVTRWNWPIQGESKHGSH